jgi:two-component system, OmpR family, response regulator
MKKVLVVDDTKNIRVLLTTCLELNGYKVSTASTGDVALKLFETEVFDLAFLDIKMPEVSGTEVLRRIRAMGIDIPVVIMTAFATVKNAVECTKLGAVAYLQKPFTTDKVKSLLAELDHNNKEEATAESYISIGRELLNAGKIDEAYTSLKMALSLDPGRSECYELIGKVHELKGDIEQAKKFYTVANQFDN